MRVSKNMDHKNADAMKINGSLRFESRWQVAFIDISANSRDGCQLLKSVIDFQVSQVPGVKDMTNAFKNRGDLWVKQSVCIRDNANDLFFLHNLKVYTPVQCAILWSPSQESPAVDPAGHYN